MGRGKPKTASEKAKKPKTEIQRKREERRAKKALPRPVALPPAPKATIPKEKKDVKPKPKPQNPGFMKWSALFKRELIVIETHIKHAERFRQHWRAEIDKMEEGERKKWESGEVGNWVRLLKNLERSREILALAREANAWIVPPNKLGLNKAGLGMKDYVLGANKTKKAQADGESDSSADEESDVMDTDDDEDSSDAAPAEFIPLNISNMASNLSKKGDAGEAEDAAAKETVEPNPYFVVDTNPTPVNTNGISKKGKKRAKEDDCEDHKAVKKSKKEKAIVVPESQTNHTAQPETEPRSNPKSSKVDFSAIEAQLQAEIEAGQKAKDEREAVKLARKEKKRKRMSEGDSEKETKKPKQEEKKEKKEKKKRKAEDSGDEEVFSDEGGKKKHKNTV